MSHTKEQRLTEADKTATPPAALPGKPNPTSVSKDIIMNTKTLFAAAALALIGSAAIADEVRDLPTPSTLTRAEVRAELDRARQDGSLSSGESYGDINLQVAAAKGKTNGQAATQLARVDVVRDLRAARANGSVAVAGEAYGSVQPGLSLRSRDDVRAEAVLAAHNRFNSAPTSRN